MDKPARRAYCTGCGVTFPKQHQLMNHRRSHNCGGDNLSDKERQMMINLRELREAQERRTREIARLLKEMRHGVVPR